MKKAIALFSTLLILVLVIILMTISLKNSTNIKKSSLYDRYLIQENLTLTDIMKLIDEQLTRKLVGLNSTQRVLVQQALFSTPLEINNPVNNSKIVVTLESNDGRLNINLVNSNDQTILNYILRVFKTIGVQEPIILKDILLANITNSNKYRDEYKLPLKQKNKRFGLINSYDDFEEILLLYLKNTDDKNILNIDFKKYFNFYIELEQNNKYKSYASSSDCKIDVNYASIEIVDSIILLPNSIRTLIQNKKLLYELPLQDSNEIVKSILEDLKTHNILIKINISSINNKVECKLNYNIETKKISTISMDRWIY